MKKEACLSIIENVQTGRVVMIKHHRGINEGFLNFPGGKKEAGETMRNAWCGKVWRKRV